MDAKFTDEDHDKASVDIEFRAKHRVPMFIELSSFREPLRWDTVAYMVRKLKNYEDDEAYNLLLYLNRYFVQLGPKKVLYRDTIDGTVQQQEFSIDELKKYPPNVTIANPKGTRPKEIPVMRWWLENPQRVMFHSMEIKPLGAEIENFKPYTIQGLDLPVFPPDHPKSRIPVHNPLKHIYAVMCQGRFESYKWIIQTMAFLWQRAGRKIPKVIAFVDERGGSGKSRLIQETLGAMFGEYYRSIRATALLDNDTSFLENNLILEIPECPPLINKTGQDIWEKIKNFATVGTNSPGQTATTDLRKLHVGNYKARILSTFFVTSNRFLTSPDRRVVLYRYNFKYGGENSTKKEAREYFDKVFGPKMKPTFTAYNFSNFLAGVDISDYDYDLNPALPLKVYDSVMGSTNLCAKYWFSSLAQGSIITRSDEDEYTWDSYVPKDEIYNGYMCFVSSISGDKIKPDRNSGPFWKATKAIFGEMDQTRKSEDGLRCYMIQLPSLEDARKAFADKHNDGEEIDWEAMYNLLYNFYDSSAESGDYLERKLPELKMYPDSMFDGYGNLREKKEEKKEEKKKEEKSGEQKAMELPKELEQAEKKHEKDLKDTDIVRYVDPGFRGTPAKELFPNLRWVQCVKPRKGQYTLMDMIQNKPTDGLLAMRHNNGYLHTVTDRDAFWNSYYRAFSKAPWNVQLHEVLIEDIHRQQKIRFDIDISDPTVNGKEIVDSLLDAVSKVFSQYGKTLKPEIDILYCTSHGKTKQSYHIILPRYMITPEQHNILYDLVLEQMPQQYREYLDISCAKSLQSFRMLYSSKIDSDGAVRMKTPKIVWYWHEKRVVCKIGEEMARRKAREKKIKEATVRAKYLWLASLLSNPADIDEDREELPLLVPPVSKKKSDYKTADIGQDFIEDAYDAFVSMYPEHGSQFSLAADHSSNIIHLIRKSGGPCLCCERDHDRDNAYLTVHDGDVWFHCHRMRQYKAKAYYLFSSQ